jgi:hypothetical protein
MGEEVTREIWRRLENSCAADCLQTGMVECRVRCVCDLFVGVSVASLKSSALGWKAKDKLSVIHNLSRSGSGYDCEDH